MENRIAFNVLTKIQMSAFFKANVKNSPVIRTYAKYIKGDLILEVWAQYKRNEQNISGFKYCLENRTKLKKKLLRISHLHKAFSCEEI